MTFQPAARPPWFDELTAFGTLLGDAGAVVPLDEDSVIDAACRLTGLDDFGGTDWREPMRVFLRSLEDEGRLHLLGRLMARTDVVRALRNRLEITETIRLHPGIVEQRVNAPVLVTGTGRSGTSILHELLAQDPRHRVLLTWEALHPVPPPEASSFRSDPRIAPAEREYVDFWNLVTPEYATMHENGGAAPQEDPVLTMPAFLSDHFMGSYPVPSYAAFNATADYRPAFAFHRLVLQLLQWHNPADRWVLKSPSYLSRLMDFFAAYPDAYVVITHRDPLKVLPSMTSLMSTLQWQKTDHVDVAHIVSSVVAGTAVVHDLIVDMRADGRLPDERIIDVLYADLMADPWGTLRTVYERIGTSLTAEAERRMRDYLARKPRERLGHRYTFADTGLDVGTTRDRYARYMASYAIPAEL